MGRIGKSNQKLYFPRLVGGNGILEWVIEKVLMCCSSYLCSY